MKLTSVLFLSALGMTTTSLIVWAATPTGGLSAEPTQIASSPQSSPPSEPDKPASFTEAGALVVEGRLGHARLAADSPGSTYLLVSAKPDAVAEKNAPPVNLAIVVDRSGSMKGRRMTHAIDAARGMVNRLRDGDVVSLIAYDTATETLVPATTLDSLSRSRVLSALSNITPQGDTCISCGLEAGMQALTARSGMVNRVLLLSDGEATAGVRDLEGFRRIAERARGMSCPISSIGVDVDYNERVLSALALESNGRHHFAETELELSRAFDAELASLQGTVAKNAEVVLDLAPGVTLKRVVDRAFRTEGSRVVVPLGTVSSGEEKTLLVELDVPRGAEGDRPIASVNVGYDDLTSGRRGSAQGKLALELTSDAARVTELDPFVSARVNRTTTADTLTEANELFKSGDVAGAQRKLERELAELRRRKGAATSATPKPKRAAIEGDFEKQEEALEQAGESFKKPAPAPGQAPADTRDGKAGLKRNQEVANPFRL